VLRGEQSNTSIVCQVVDANGDAAKPVIVKVFRSLHPGENPDVVVQSALTEAGSTQVPHTVGSVAGEWADPVSGERVRGHLMFAQRFLPGVEDAWRVALRAATDGDDFTESARELGEATAHIHVSLAQALGTTPADADVKAELLGVIRSRYDAAVAEVPSLATYGPAVVAALEDLADRDWPDLQRVHGDYHLGQVLRTADGWVAVDFEGEPLRPLSERVRPDLALRDVAGMLRSFDYVGGSVEVSQPDRSARSWVAACREAFVDGYVAVSGLDLLREQPVLRALELDKALYEVVYEARNRPTWVGIPSAAIERLVASTRSDISVQQGAVARKGAS
jgi:predicted trehalose synthase